MGIISGPKAINIIRPASNTKLNNQPSSLLGGDGLSIKSTTKVATNQTIHKPKKSKPLLNLYNPKQQNQGHIPLNNNNNNKKPSIELYKPQTNKNKFQLRRSISTSIISPSKRKLIQTNRHSQQQISLSENALRIHNNSQQILNQGREEGLAMLSDSSSESSRNTSAIEGKLLLVNHGNDESDYSISSEVDDDDDEEKNKDDEDNIYDDTRNEDALPEARINRKLADLEISNQSLLIINEMLETTVRHQAKQVASFKKQMMTFPNDANEQQRQQEAQVLLLQQIQQAENEDDWEQDEQFNRLRRMTELLIQEAEKALSYQVETGGRVITGHHHRRSSSRRLHRHRSERHHSSSSSSISNTSVSSSNYQQQ